MAGLCSHEGPSHYLPLRTETKIYQRRRVTVTKPLFPGYVFARFTPEQRVTLLKSNAVVRIIEAPRQRELLHQLAQIRKALLIDPSLGACEAIKAGRRVQVTAGPFQGIEGIVASVKGHTLVRLNIELIGQAVALEIERDALALLD